MFLKRRSRRRVYFQKVEMDEETGLYYYGARYLDPKYSRWLSGDPALSDYIPKAPVDDEAKKHNENLPGMGGVFNVVNLHLYHYAGNNPVKYTDPDGKVAAIDDATIAAAIVITTGVIAMANNQSYKDSAKEVSAYVQEKMNGISNWVGNTAKEIGTSIYNAVQSFEDKKAAIKTRINEITQDKDKNSSTGSYTINFESGMKYHGKGGQKRSMQSAMRIGIIYGDMPVDIDWTPSPNHREAFKDEYKRIQDDGGPSFYKSGNRRKNYNKIQSPGRLFYIIDNGHEYKPEVF